MGDADSKLVYLRLGHKHAIDIEMVANCVVEMTYSSIAIKDFESSHSRICTDLRLNFDESVEERDMAIIRVLEWLTYDIAWRHHFFYWACAFARVFLFQRKLRLIDSIRNIAPHFFSESVGDMSDLYILEFLDYQNMLSCVSKYNRWAELHYRQKPHFIPSGVER